MTTAPARRRRSHPPTLITLARRALVDEIRLERGARVLVACSGGTDSMALLHVMATLAPKLGFSLVAHGVDHGLRPEAGAELDQARQAAAGWGVELDVTRIAVPKGGNLQARAREARFDALRKAAAAAGARWIATAHTADDRAETVLLRLLRGTGPRGLAVLPARADDKIRPLLRATRADVAAHLARHRIPYAEDPSNRDPRFLRVRVRRELWPLLHQLSPRFSAHLCELADACGEIDAPAPLLAGLNAAQRRAVAQAAGRGRKDVLLRLEGGREVRLALADARSDAAGTNDLAATKKVLK